MALKGLDIFKLTPKKNCKECGSPTCMAFAMKVASGAVTLDKCPYMSQEALDKLAEASEPLMKTVAFGTGANAQKIGGETVLFRHEKTLVNKTLFACPLTSDMTADEADAALAAARAVDFERIGEREYIECVYVADAGCGAERFLELVRRAAQEDRALILETDDAGTAKAALGICGARRPILNGAHAGNLADMNAVAAAAGVPLGVRGANLDELADNVRALEAMGNRNLVLDVTGATIRETFAGAVLVRRTNLKDQDRSMGYPSIVNLWRLADDAHLQTALAAAFTLKYGSIIVMNRMGYPQALALYGLRQNLFTDPQKPMKVTPGIYPLNGADEYAPCSVTVDFALTYFLVSGEYERSKCPVNLLISDASGMSVLTAWAAGKLSAGSIKQFFDEFDIEHKIKSRDLIIPGKVAVLKSEIEAKLPGWNVVVGPMEAVQLVGFIRDFVSARRA